VQRRSSRDRHLTQKPAVGRTPTVGAFDAGLRLLGVRAHARAELRRKLGRRGYEADEVEAALRMLIELGYLDDASFARGLVRRRAALRGPKALSAELAARGVDRARADAALAEFDPASQLASATHLAERLYARKRVAGYREMLEVVGSRLVRRGFSPAIVQAACRAVLTGTSGDAGA
jgi:regulatory protein